LDLIAGEGLRAGLPAVPRRVLLPAAPALVAVLGNTARPILPHVVQAVAATETEQLEALTGAWKGCRLHRQSIAAAADVRMTLVVRAVALAQVTLAPMYGLLDANITAAYYLARSMRSEQAVDRIRIIVDSVRTKGSDHFLYIPNVCIAETFSVLMKYAFGKWNRQVQKAGTGTIDKRVYERLIEQFRHDIHNGRVLNQYELSRYHVLAQDLVAPVDHHYQYRRGKKRRHAPMGTFDRLFVAMGIHLAHVHRADNVVLLTADDRIADIVGKCRDGIPAKEGVRGVAAAGQGNGGRIPTVIMVYTRRAGAS
jgi:hypothetical protein